MHRPSASFYVREFLSHTMHPRYYSYQHGAPVTTRTNVEHAVGQGAKRMAGFNFWRNINRNLSYYYVRVHVRAHEIRNVDQLGACASSSRYTATTTRRDCVLVVAV